ncbi:hypothetical protein MXB_2341, partial [Myxobolus squamalis]
MYWLDNKETEIRSYADNIFGYDSLPTNSDLLNIPSIFDGESHSSKTNFDNDGYSRAIAIWNMGPDVIYAISPIDG